ncbi:MAG: Penicillin-binding protein [Acidobacteriales bacterium]|nr:Penicillin-binding protein [Terriglobales bacterium]
MAIKLKIPKGKRGRFHPSNPVIRAAVAAFIILCTVVLGIFAVFYIRYQKLIDQRMSGPVFANASKIYATPRVLTPGFKATRDEVATQLRRAGYSEESEKGESKLGTYHLVSSGIQIRPGPESFHSPENALIKFHGDTVQAISSLDKGDAISEYELEPQLVTGLFDNQQRSKRRLITYDDMPTSLVNAVIAIEDRRFFQHSGINYWRFLQAGLRDLQSRRRAEGASTLTMQISRGFFLTPEKTYTRKLSEMMIAIELEQRFSKKQIFEFYANQIYMGQRGSFTINGLGEAAQAYLNKDIKNLTLPESAMLAGIIQRPNYFNPYRNKEATITRRNIVLNSMVETGAISRDEADKAKATGLNLSAPNVEASDAPYFVDLVKDNLLQRYTEEQLNEDGLRIYSSIDPDLQRAAAEAVEVGIKEIDELVKKSRRKKIPAKTKGGKAEIVEKTGPVPQVALVAMNPETGEVLAMVGGRNYGFSQLNHAVAKRPTGSIFKPFVFATAVNTALDGQQPVFTPASMVDNTPTTFFFEDQVYEPRNYENKYNEIVTARFALAHSLNNATVRIAEQVGYNKVAELAQAAGIKGVKPTPAMALGAYDATPLEMAAAYTAFANKGLRSNPVLITSVRNAQGEVIEDFKTEKKQIMDPRVAYVMTNMMEGVINNGTATAVHARGFTAPAAGKTGTSHDAWFAGYTSNLLCVVWVGYDDYSDLKQEGNRTAAPIWTEFMKRAVKLPAYQDVKPFTPPDGVVNLNLDKVTNRIATATCPDDYTAAFIAGTEPKETCDQSGDQRGFFSKLFGLGQKPLPPPPVSINGQQQQTQQQPGQNAPAQAEDPAKKKGFFGKIFGAFKDDKKKEPEKQNPPPAPNPK